MILADTSAWIEFDRATSSPVDRRITTLIKHDGDLAVTEPVIMELLAGARDDRAEAKLRSLLARFELIRFDAACDFESAALVYRRCRAAGVTPRGVIDCMIAAVAWRAGARVLSHDADFARMASVIEIDLDEASVAAS